MSKPVREEWMMKLPDEIRPIGMYIKYFVYLHIL